MTLKRHHVASAQSAIWVTAGLWPLFHMRSFERVTGPKKEPWLVRTIGLLLASTGVALGAAARRRRVTPELALAGGTTAASLAGIDLRYGIGRRISPVYLLDAALQLALVAGWIVAKD